jgi:hypothetical protein
VKDEAILDFGFWILDRLLANPESGNEKLKVFNLKSKI